MSNLRKWNDYKGGKLTISWIIYGSPDIRWHLQEEFPNCNSLIAESTDRAEIEALKEELTGSKH
jgi:hypothetical protein